MLPLDISPEASGFYSRIVLDYLSGKEELKPFYKYPHHFGSFAEAIKNRQFSKSNRQLLKDVLMEQYEKMKLKKNSPVILNIEALGDEDSFTVTTGHQLCVNTGPVYFLYKIIHTLKLADELNKSFPDKKIIPVYWMASEDHDFEEIRSFVIDGKTFVWNRESGEEPVGRLDLKGIDELFAQLKTHFKEKQNNTVVEVFERCYKNAASLAEATRLLVNTLFENYGLVIIDPDDARLKEVITPVMREDILNQSSYSVLTQTNTVLKKLHYKTQAHGRNINFFYLSDAGRKLILPESGQYRIEGTSLLFTRESMENEIKAYPGKFSPNVVMRPLYQEAILPNLSYIGGPGEIAYWLQLKDIFSAFELPFPILILRNSFALLSHSLRHKLTKLNIDVSTLFLREDKRVPKALSDLEPNNNDPIFADMEERLQDLINKLIPVDNKIASTVIRYKAENKTWFMGLKKAIRQAGKQKYAEELERLDSVRNHLFRDTTPVERINNVLCYETGDISSFIRFIYENSVPVITSVKLLAY